MEKLFYGQGAGGRIKQKSEDFIVEEITEEGTTCTVDDKSNFNNNKDKKCKYLHLTLIKKNKDTFLAAKLLSKHFRVSEKMVTFAGIKDKLALSAQRLCINGARISKSLTVSNSLRIKDQSYSDEKIYPGKLWGNRFTIIIIGAKTTRKQVKDFMKKTTKSGIPNYFGKQRFGKKNAELGKLLVKGEFKKFVAAYKKVGQKNVIKKIEEHLKKQKKDHIGAATKVPKKVLTLLIHAYQSQIFNRSLALSLSGKWEQKSIEIVGFDTKIENEETKKVMEEEYVTTENFIIKKMPWLSQTGSKRPALFFPKDFEILVLHKDVLKIRFILKKGCYATVLLEELTQKNFGNAFATPTDTKKRRSLTEGELSKPTKS